LADAAMRLLARLLVRVFFRRVEVEHGDRLPSSVPVVLVANHINGLVDGLLLMCTLGRYPRFLGKSTLFRLLPLWPFLKLAGVIPVHRAIDGATGEQNMTAFATCRAILAERGLVALFPEGISHDELTLQPLRTGAARIALEATVEDGTADVVLVAVGVTYDAKARFRSRALVRIGEPVSVDQWVADYGRDSHAAVRQVTDHLAQQLHAVAPPYSSWAQAEQLSRIAEVVVRTPVETLPAEVALGVQIEVADQLARADARGDRHDDMAAVRATFAAYEKDLTLLGLSDAQVSARYSTLKRSLAWSFIKVLVALPFAVVGLVVHLIPFGIVKWVATRPTNEGMKATVKLLGCTALFALTYGAVGYLVSLIGGPWLGIGAAAVSALGGYAAVRLAERVRRIDGLLEGWRTMRDRGQVIGTVMGHRDDVVRTARRAVAFQ
jgi:glycerol-3-phosphate O-acyltransferase/dihydroxyacetone phosphate acyltransferase